MLETVLVTGVGGPAGRAGAGWLAGRGYRVVGTDMRRVESPATAFRLVPAAADAAFGPALLDIAVREGVALVLPTVTEELPVVARMRGDLRALGISLSSSDPLGVDVAGDKLRTAQVLEREGIAVPATCAAATSPDELGARLGFPLLSKPRFGRGGRGVLLHRSRPDLETAFPAEVVFQEFLPGEEFDLNLYLEADGRPAAAVVLRKLGLRQGLVGNAIAVERAERPDVVALGVRAARALRLEGPLDLDIRLRGDGAPAVLEVNARIGAHVLAAGEVLLALDDAWRNGRCA